MWKDIKECNNYEISSYGEVRRKDTGKILKQKLDKNNCLMVNLSLGARGKAKYFIVHRLVAQAFLPNPDNLYWVKHKDGNPLNNKVSNLEWVEGKWTSQPQGEQAHNSKLTKEQVKWCRDVYKPRDKKYGCSALAKQFNVAISTMSYILNDITYN